MTVKELIGHLASIEDENLEVKISGKKYAHDFCITKSEVISPYNTNVIPKVVTLDRFRN